MAFLTPAKVRNYMSAYRKSHPEKFTTAARHEERYAIVSIQPKPPAVSRTTTVANVSTTQRFPVERSSAAKPLPQTRPPVQPQAAAPVVSKPAAGISKAPSALRDSLEAAKNPRPGAPRVLRIPNYNTSADPPEGIGSGGVPSGGVKVR